MDTLASINELFPSRAAESTRGTNSVDELGSDAFLTLMVAQLENQDPTKPMDNMDFIAQLAQFGSVSGIQELNDSFADLAASLSGNQALEAASLVGRSVVTESNLGTLEARVTADGESVLALDASIDFDGPTAGGAFYVQDLAGRMIYSSALPPSSGGLFKVRWDGLDASGNPVPPGTYRVSADAIVNGQNTAVSVYAHQRVDSVSVDGASVTLTLASGNDVSLSRVKQFL